MTWQALLDSLNSDGLNIVYNPINVHISKKSGRTIKYIVVHYTAGSSSKAGSAEKIRNVWLKREASADYVVDDATIMQVNPDPANYYCWAVGDGKGQFGIYNKDCISIEMCSTLASGTSSSVPNHKGWSISDAVLNNTLELVKYLMQVYHIDADHVIRHYDATHKMCPGIIGWNPGYLYNASTGERTKVKNNEDKWFEFKKRLTDK